MDPADEGWEAAQRPPTVRGRGLGGSAARGSGGAGRGADGSPGSGGLRRPGVGGGEEAPGRAPSATFGGGLPVGEVLHQARERKGVDLYRAERDTKIRARYLAALERGDHRELPGQVYTTGFLRNYALYLGLSPDEVLAAWRRERGESSVRPESPIVPRRQLPASARALSISPSVVVAGLMVLVVVALGIYLAIQLLRFARPPFLEITRPNVAIVDVGEADTTYTIQGMSVPGASITITTPGRDQPYRTTATEDGSWAIQVDLRRGSNKFEVSALDRETGRAADQTRTIQVNVPFLLVQAPTLTVTQPVEGTVYENGAIPVVGSAANAGSIQVTAQWLGAVASGPAAPTPAAVALKDDGTFSSPLELTAGRWSITITATSPQGKSASLTRTISVAYKGVTLVVTIKGSQTWLKVWVDGIVSPETTAAGKTVSAGTVLTFTGSKSVEIRTGISSNTSFTLNGTNLGSLGKSAVAETWLFQPPDPPVKTNRT